ncbi:MAG: reverse gyrase, partial [Thermoprotei archaeon]
YIQASGRTSRMFAGGISRGASIVIVDDKKVFEGLVRKSRWIVEDIEWKALEEVNIKELIDEIDRDRNIIKMLREGRIRAEFKDPVKSALLIVESPSKARTIANFFGRPSRRRIGRLTVYEISTGRYMLSIVASGGHVFDLVMRREGIYGTRVINGKFIPVYGTIRRCLSCGEQFVGLDKCPVCKSEEYYDKVDIIRTLEDLAREVDIVLLGTDPDTEGEKISWDIAVSLKPYTKRTNRIEFHEVTKRAILEALEHPRDINTLLVEAQIVRRIEDRWIGFMLSEELWETFGSRRLSAGRVQTPVLGWIIERYNEYRRSIKDFFYLTLENGLRLVLEDYPIKESPKATLEELKDAVCTVEKAEFNEVELTPPPPFTTDSMIREASSLLGIEAIETMSIAQDLFEFGLITYHRTDSTRVSSVGRAIAKEYISENIGPDYYQGREWLREGAHECIRPTRPLDVDKLRLLIRDGILRVPRPLTRNHYRLYSLIFNRFMASQMKPAKVVKAHYVLDINGYKKELEGIVEVLYDGFLKMYPLREPLLPRMDQGMKLKVTSALHQRRPSIKLFSQGEVVDLMRKRGIGRPSTYAKIIRTLLERRYVIESRKKRRLIPTKLGIKVYEFLSQNYKTLVSEERTRKLEELMDKIELGQEDYQKVIKELYEEMKSFARVGYD